MPELAAQLRSYFDAIDPPFAVADLMVLDRPVVAPERTERTIDLPSPSRPPRRRQPRWWQRGWALAVVALVVTLAVLGGFVLLAPGDDSEVVDEPTPTTSPTPTTQAQPSPTTPAPVPPSGFATIPIDTEGVVGEDPIIAIAPSGNPVMAYRGQQDIKIAICSDPTCTTVESVVSIGQAVGDGWLEGPSLALLADGTPIVAYATPAEAEGEITSDLIIVACDDPACLTWTSSIVVEGSQVGQPVVAISGAGLPLVVHFADQEARLIRCADVACSTRESTIIETAAQWTGGMFGAVSDPPAFLYQMDDLTRLATCVDQGCTELAVTVIDDTNYWAPAFAQGADGPVIATLAPRPPTEEGDEDEPPGDLIVISCLDPLCQERISSPILATGPQMDVGDVVVDEDGYPVVVFDTSGADLTVLRCLDPRCESGVTTGVPTRGGAAALAIGVDGNPLLAYGTGSDLVLVRCADAACADVPAPPPPPQEMSFSDPGWSTSIVTAGAIDWPPPQVAFDTDGLPVIVAQLATEGIGPEGEVDSRMAVVHCASPACTEASVGDPSQYDGQWGAIALDGAGRTVTAYWSYEEDRTLGFVRCDDTTCSDATDKQLLTASAWAEPDIAIGSDGLPVMAFQNYTFNPGPIQVVHCADADCDVFDAVDLDFDCVDDTCERFWVHNTTSLALTSDDRPVVAYTSSSGRLRLVVCADAKCDSWSASTLDDTGSASEAARVEIGPDGNPIVGYYADGTARLAFCLDPLCEQIEIAELGEAARGPFYPPELSVLGDGRVVLGFLGPNRDHRVASCPYPCADPAVSSLPDIQNDAYTIAAGPDGLLLIAYVEDFQSLNEPPWSVPGNLVVAKCTDPGCLGG